MPQISANGLIKENLFFKNSKNNFDLLFKRYSSKDAPKSKYIVLQPVRNLYDLEHISFDPVSFFSDSLIHKLKSKTLSLIFDCSMEGSQLLFPYYSRFQQSIISNNLPLENFYYLTGDVLEKDINSKTNKIYHINILDSIVKYTNLNSSTTITSYFTCLNRKPRYWRSRLIYEMLNTQYKEKIIASHVKVESKNDFMNHDGFDVEDCIVDFFIEHTPMQVSNISPLSKNMSFTDVISSLPEVYRRAAFDVTLETYQERDHEYITEKTFKPMLNMMPVIIWGTPEINTRGLKRLGFKTYEDWFDLSFDNEPNTEKRLRLLIEEILRVCSILDNCNLDKWQKKNIEILEYNKNLILNLLPTNKSEFARLHSDLDRA